MKGDFSRRTFRRERHYAGVLMQQGRVQLDSDWNEMAEIVNYRADTGTADIAGAAGAPEENAGFGIVANITKDTGKLTPREQALIAGADESALQAGDFWITPGRMYVDGILCENDSLVRYTEQSDLPPMASGTLPKIGQQGWYLAYLDVWQRHISATEDPDLREKALGGPDTATRLKTVWQVRYKLLAAQPSGCDNIPEWAAICAPTRGTMEAKGKKPDIQSKPCILPPDAGYGGLENRLYLVEIHKGSKTAAGASQTPTFKWSRDNGSIVFPITTMASDIVQVSDACRYMFNETTAQQWAELLDDDLELNGSPGQLFKIKTPPGADGKIQLSGVPAKLNIDRHPKMRLWDGADIPIDYKEQSLDPSSQIVVQFTGNDFKPGDGWMIPARTAIAEGKGSVDWMPAGPQSPHFNAHHYAKLAILYFGLIQGTEYKGLMVSGNCRKLFPPLTNLKASDVSYQNPSCRLSGGTVKDALDTLCKRGAGDCTITITPGPLDQATFDNIAEKSVKICLQMGSYTADKTIVITGKDNVRLTGCGPGTSVIAKAEAVFRFEGCKSVIVKDLYAESTVAMPGKGISCLNGTLTFCACKNVTVEDAELKCAPGIGRMASCINVRDATAYDHRSLARPSFLTGLVRVNDCNLHVGHLQTGILLVNVDKAYVEGNVIDTYDKPQGFSMASMLKDSMYRAMVRNTLLSASGIDTIAKSFTYTKGLPRAVPKTKSSGKGKGAINIAMTGNNSTKKSYTVIGHKAGKKLNKPAAADKTVVKAARGKANKSTAAKKSTPAGEQKATSVDKKPPEKVMRMPSSVTDKTLTDAWNLWIGTYKPQGIKRSADLYTYVAKLADKLLLKETWASTGKDKFDMFRPWWNLLHKEDVSVASQGIVVSGNLTSASDVRIAGNDIRGVIQGIHIGVSHRENKAGNPDNAGRVCIDDNYIAVKLPPLQMERHGIFVGNCNSISVTNNRIDISRMPAAKDLQVEGIRVYGYVGPMMVIRQNHITNANVGVRIGMLRNFYGKPQWIVGDNMALSASIKPVLVDAPTDKLRQSIQAKLQYYNTNFS